jgi:hypothetical protein
MEKNKPENKNANNDKPLFADIVKSERSRRKFLQIIGLAGFSLPLISGTSITNVDVSTTDISSLVSNFKLQIKKELMAAALKEGVKVDEHSISIGILSEGILVNAALKGLATVNMTEYEKGIATNFLYVDSKATSLKPGFYKVTTIAQKVNLGRVTVKAEYSQAGKVIQTSSGVAQIHSLKVPANVNPDSPVKVGVSMEQAFEKGYDTDPAITITAICPNGGNARIALPRVKA